MSSSTAPPSEGTSGSPRWLRSRPVWPHAVAKKSPPVARTPIEMHTATLLHDPHSPKIPTHSDYH